MLLRRGMQRSFDARPLRAVVVSGLIVGLVLAGRLHAAETITATAQAKTAGGTSASAPLTVTLDRLSTDDERQQVMTALKTKDGSASVRALLDKWKPIGSVRLGGTTTPVKYAFARPTGGGRLLTVVTGSAIAFVGAGLPNAAPRTGFDLGLVLLDVPSSGAGSGELAPAAKLALNAQGALVTEDYGKGTTILLSNVTGK
jgi:hypothetical protein